MSDSGKLVSDDTCSMLMASLLCVHHLETYDERTLSILKLWENYWLDVVVGLVCCCFPLFLVCAFFNGCDFKFSNGKDGFVATNDDVSVVVDDRLVHGEDNEQSTLDYK